MQVNLVEIERRIASGHIRRQWTEDGSLQILNYTHKTQYDKAWDEYTTLARGLILRADGTVHAKSLKKFWNLFEPPGPALNELPPEPPEITLKLDGFLGLSYWYNGRLNIASRGSFTSEYALWATDWFRSLNPRIDTEMVDKNHTMVFEILYPHRRIVVDNSGKHGLVLLAIVNNETGEEMPRSAMELVGTMFRVPVVESYPTRTLEQCVALGKTLKGTETEGFVAHYRNAGLRVKIKGDDYCKIHRLVTQLTKRRIWEILVQPTALTGINDLTSVIPKEYSDWISATVVSLVKEYSILYSLATSAALETRALNLPSRKDVVACLCASTPLWHEALYLLDGKLKVVSDLIWKRIRPQHELPILRDGEDE